MAYEVLARKWRPKTFSEVVGQEHITRTLQNAISQNRVGHAYLFVGPRGTGKTTTARIFAKALNCDKGIVTEPCCECTNCLEIAEGASLDVNELDGASHNRVDHIRDIRQNVQYSPSRGRFKIYIIDEVHMLTPSAWNALLKTLEEPPPHVKFLFATTEPHKVLPTIVSRCQRFDLKAIPVPLIVERLRQIADQEGIRVEDAALNAIARAADGGMRDAQSIFDQMIAFCGGLAEGNQISEQDVIDVFGLASGAELRTLAVGMFRSDLDEAIGVIQGLADHGRDLERVYADLVSYVRNIMVCSVCRDPSKIVEVGEAELQDCLAIADAVDAQMVQRVLQGLVREEWAFRSALNKRLYFEATLARVMLDAHSVQLNDIIAQLSAAQGNEQAPNAPAPAPRTIPDIPPPPPKPEPKPTENQTPPAAEANRPAPNAAPEAPPAAPAADPQPAAPAQTQASPPETDEQAPETAPENPPAAAEEPSNGPAETDTGSESEPPPQQAAAEDPVQATPAATPESSAQPEPEVADEQPERQEAVSPPEEKTAEDGADAVDDVAEPDTEETAVQESSGSDEAASDNEEDAPQEWDPPEPEDEPFEELELDMPMPPPPPRFDDPEALFQALLEQLDGHPRGDLLLPLIKRLRPVSVIENVFQLAYDDAEMSADDVERVLDPETRDILQECLTPVASDPDLVVVVKRWIASVSGSSQPMSRQATPAEREEIAQLPFVRRVCEQVDGSVIDARVMDGEGE